VEDGESSAGGGRFLRDLSRSMEGEAARRAAREWGAVSEICVLVGVFCFRGENGLFYAFS